MSHTNTNGVTMKRCDICKIVSGCPHSCSGGVLTPSVWPVSSREQVSFSQSDYKRSIASPELRYLGCMCDTAKRKGRRSVRFNHGTEKPQLQPNLIAEHPPVATSTQYGTSAASCTRRRGMQAWIVNEEAKIMPRLVPYFFEIQSR